MSLKVCVLGDRFVLPEPFEAPLRAALGDDIDLVMHRLEWPDSETVAGDKGDPVREYSGDADEVVRLAEGAEVLVVHMAPVSRRVIEALASLRVVAVARGGPVNVDRAACEERGIAVMGAPGRNAGAVAEFTVGALIGGTRGLVSGAAELRDGVWSRAHYRYAESALEVKDMTVGLVGYSHIGRRIGHLLRAFGTEVLFADPYREPDDDDRARGIERVELDALLERSDAVSLHARLTDETRRMADAAFFARMKQGATFLNNARGELVDETALLGALESGRVGRAILDTFDPEPPAPDSALIRHPNTIATPHLAGASRTSAHLVAKIVAEALGEWMKDAAPGSV